MLKKPAIQTIEQKDNYTFSIVWTDGKSADYRLSDLQAQCPCAQCVDENTGQRKVDPASIPINLTAKRLKNVGRYAIKIDFTEGCSLGIYSFDFLRERMKV